MSSGWKTDRGRIYIILGEPRGIDHHIGETQIYYTEVWFYQGLTQYGLPTGFNLGFFQKGGVGEYVLYSPSADGPQALGEFDQAIAVYNKALSHYGINLNLLNSIGECYYRLGIWGEALAAWEKSLEINDHQPDVEEKVKILKKKISELD